MKFAKFVHTRTISTALSIAAFTLAAGNAASAPTAHGGCAGFSYEVRPHHDGPLPAARICNVQCTETSEGTYYTFEIEALKTHRQHVYSIEIEQLEDTVIDALTCPAGWTSEDILHVLGTTDRYVIFTSSNPIPPGSRLGGFGLLSSSPRTIMKWYPADSERVRIGRVTREELSCPTDLAPYTWGQVKALHR